MQDWERLEQHVLWVVKGRATNGSGRFNTKGDIRTDDLYIECKYRANRKTGRALDLSWFKTAENHTKGTGLVPIIAFQTGNEETKSDVFYFCREADSYLFSKTSCEFLASSGWVAISETSLSEFAEKMRELNESK